MIANRCPAALEKRTKNGWLPLHVAAQYSTYEVSQTRAPARSKSERRTGGSHFISQPDTLPFMLCSGSQTRTLRLSKKRRVGGGFRCTSSLSAILSRASGSLPTPSRPPCTKGMRTGSSHSTMPPAPTPTRHWTSCTSWLEGIPRRLGTGGLDPAPLDSFTCPMHGEERFQPRVRRLTGFDPVQCVLPSVLPPGQL